MKRKSPGLNFCFLSYITATSRQTDRDLAESSVHSLALFVFIYILEVDGTSASTEAEIVSTQDEIITYVNHTAKLSCIVKNKNRHHVNDGDVSSGRTVSPLIS